MRVAQEKVREFHEKYDFPAPDEPTAGSRKLIEERDLLMSEELREYREASQNGDIVAIADALADLAYTVLGSAVAHGINLEPIFEEVHRSNMTKDVGEFKPVKGAGFKKPMIADLLLLQAIESRHRR